MFDKIKKLYRELKNIDMYKKEARDGAIRLRNVERAVEALRAQQHIMFWQLYKKPEEDLLAAKLRFFHSLPQAEGNARKSQLVMLELLKRIHKTCEENNIKYWLDFGSLLGAIRHSGFIPWDDDIDLGMMRKDAEKLCEIMGKDKEVFVRFYYTNGRENGITRNCQIRWAKSPYGMYTGSIDIFLYDFCKAAPTAANWEYWKQKKHALREDSEAYPEARGALKNLIAGNTQEVLRNAYEKHFAEVREKLQIKMTEAENIVFGWDNFCYFYKDRHMFKKEQIFPLTSLEYEGTKFYVPREYFEYSMSTYGDIFTLPSDLLSHTHVDVEKHLRSLNYLYERYVKRVEKDVN